MLLFTVSTRIYVASWSNFLLSISMFIWICGSASSNRILNTHVNVCLKSFDCSIYNTDATDELWHDGCVLQWTWEVTYMNIWPKQPVRFLLLNDPIFRFCPLQHRLSSHDTRKCIIVIGWVRSLNKHCGCNTSNKLSLQQAHSCISTCDVM